MGKKYNKRLTIGELTAMVQEGIDKGFTLPRTAEYFNLHKEHFRKVYHKPPKSASEEEVRKFRKAVDQLRSKAKVVSKHRSADKDELGADDVHKKAYAEVMYSDDGNRCLGYYYSIPRKDQPPLENTMTPEEAQIICEYYPYLSQSYFVNRFYWIKDQSHFQRILNAFGWRKDSTYLAPHQKRFLSPEEQRERMADVKFEVAKILDRINREEDLIKRVNQLTREMRNLQDTNDWRNKLIEKIEPIPERQIDVLTSKLIKVTNDQNREGCLTAIFADMHVGKNNKNYTINFQEGNGSAIIYGRVKRMAETIVQQWRVSGKRDILLLELGDLVQTILPDGMHPEEYRDMDLFGADQIRYAVGLLTYLIRQLLDNTPEYVKIYFKEVKGNHDRIGQSRAEDRLRVAAQLAMYWLQDRLNHYRRVEVTNTQDRVLSFTMDYINYVLMHGDEPIAKKHPTKIVSQHVTGPRDYFTLVLHAHVHYYSILYQDEYLLGMSCAPLMAPDFYATHQLGVGGAPGFHTGYRSKGFGFDHMVHSLYLSREELNLAQQEYKLLLSA